jgi:hypothetical protein
LYKITNIPNDDNTVQRTIVAGSEINDSIVKLLGESKEKLIMVDKPMK